MPVERVLLINPSCFDVFMADKNYQIDKARNFL